MLTSLISNLNSGQQVKQLWDHFRQQEGGAGNAEASLQFQRFLERVSENIQSKEKEKLNIELFMRQQNESKEEELKRLSEEMEMQIKREREMILENVSVFNIYIFKIYTCTVQYLYRI